jgi:hypothetical protein
MPRRAVQRPQTRRSVPDGDRSYPADHLGGTATEWRQQKRQEWKAVLDALSRFERGSAYAPCGFDVHWVRREADGIWENLQGDWIAWPLLKPTRKGRRR